MDGQRLSEAKLSNIPRENRRCQYTGDGDADIIEYTLKQKWRWAGHIARMKDNGLNAAQSGNQGEGRDQGVCLFVGS